MLPSVAPHEVGFDEDTVNVGKGFTVIVPIVAVLEQPVAVSVYTIFAVPSETPVTTPPFVMVATLGLLLVQVPPVAGAKFKVAPSQTTPPEGIVTVGKEFTVTVLVAVAFGQPPVPVTV